MKKEIGEVLKKVGEECMENRKIQSINKRNSLLSKFKKDDLVLNEVDETLTELAEDPKNKELLLELAALIVFEVMLLDIPEGAKDENI